MAKYSCIPGHPGFRRFTVREDFLLIAKSWGNALALHCAEIETNEIITYARAEGGYPEDTLPLEEYRWFGLTGREAEAMTLGLQGHAAFDYVLSTENHSKVPSLVQLGFLRIRWIARPYGTWPKLVATEIHRDIRGKGYIIVDDRAGHYRDLDGIVHSAIKEKFLVSRQFLLHIDQVNAALDALHRS